MLRFFFNQSYLVICGEGKDKMLNTTEEPPANTQFTAEDLPLYKAGRGIYLVLSPIMLAFGFIGKSSFCKHTPFIQCNLGKLSNQIDYFIEYI